MRLTGMGRTAMTALVAAAGVVAALLTGCSGSGPGSGQQAIPRALVVAGGREIVVPASLGCSSGSRLTATATASQVTLVLHLYSDPRGAACAAVARGPVAIMVMISRPLGHRSLVDGTGRGRIPYLDGARLPRLTYLPPGYRFSHYVPFPSNGWERVYTSSNRQDAPIQVIQAPGHDAAGLERWANRRGPVVKAGGRTLTVHLNATGAQVYGRGVSWPAGGWSYAVGSIEALNGQQPLSERQLIEVVNGLRPGTTTASS